MLLKFPQDPRAEQGPVGDFQGLCCVDPAPKDLRKLPPYGRDTVGAPGTSDSEGTLTRVPPQRTVPASSPARRISARRGPGDDSIGCFAEVT